LMLLSSSKDKKNTTMTTPCSTTFTTPTPQMIEAYTMQVMTIVRAGDLAGLQKLHYEDNVDLNCSNRFGESILHYCCRRGFDEMVRFLLDVVQANTTIVDDSQRNMIHFACWAAEPNMNLMDYLMENLPIAYWSAPDIRGHTPLDYVRREHWNMWCDFLRRHAMTIHQSSTLNNNNDDASLTPPTDLLDDDAVVAVAAVPAAALASSAAGTTTQNNNNKRLRVV
jgi:ankyrin repeat protein